MTSSCLTISSFLSDRKEGFWNRALLTGVQFSEMILSFFLTYSFIVCLLFLGCIPTIGSIYDTKSIESYLLFSLLMFALCVTFLFTGIMISTLCDSFTLANLVMVASITFLTLLGGGFYPMEKCREIYQIVAKILPLTFPGEAIRSILIKDYGLKQRPVQLGFICAFVWSIIAITASLFILKHRRFSRNT